jgi:sentrin-specific protease 1
MERDLALCNLYPANGRKKSHFFLSFFIAKLMKKNENEYDFDAVDSWTKNFNISDKRRLYFPINIGNVHWTLMVLYVEETLHIHYYDSMGGSGRRYINALIWYLIEKARRQNGPVLNENDFEVTDHGRFIPQQENGFDCGMFCCLNALFDMEDLPKIFTQDHIPNFRLRFCLDILEEKLSYPVTL